MDDNQEGQIELVGTIHVQFNTMLQREYITTDNPNDTVFVAELRGMFGRPPKGEPFNAIVQLTVGAAASDDAYMIQVAPRLSRLGASATFREQALAYVDGCMRMTGIPNWRMMRTSNVSSNLMSIPGPVFPVTLDDDSTGTW